MTDKQSNTPEWERETINKLVFAAVNEQKRARRWNILFRSLFVLWLFAILITLLATPATHDVTRQNKIIPLAK